MNMDETWEQWAQRDPYFAVQTAEKFRRENLTPEAKREFFETGRIDFERLREGIYDHLVVRPWVDRTILEYGCGVGRLLIPAAKVAEEVVGVDVSSTMLKEAGCNCAWARVDNVLLISTATFEQISNKYSLVFSYSVFQHIPPEQGMRIFGKLLGHIEPGGVGVFHFTYAGLPSGPNLSRKGDPEMKMYRYELNRVIAMIQEEGVKDLHAEFTDHGGEWGVILYFRKP